MSRPAPRWEVDAHPELLTTHHWWTLCALTELERTGVIRLRFRSLRATPHRASARLVVRDADNGATYRVALDLHDEPSFHGAEHEWADVIFKRSLSGVVPHGIKARPLGLTILLRAPESTSRALREQWALIRAGLARRTEVDRRQLIGSLRATADLLWVTTGRRSRASVPEVLSFYESQPRPRVMSPKISFLVRAWDPRGLREPSATDFASRSAERATMIRALRAHFGPSFVGGFVPTPYVSEEYPDCLAEVPTGRRAFVELTARAGIAISTRGLAGSNPWKLAEYLAAGVAIVSEPLQHEIPSPLVEGDNAIFFDDVAGCISSCERLLGDADLLEHIRSNNLRFWQQEVRPDQLLRNRLTELGTL